MKLCSSLALLVAMAANAQWERVNVSTSASLRGLSVVSQNVIWASGSDGTIMRTGDGGRNWSVITVPGAEKLDFRGIRAFDEKTAVIMSSGPAEKGQARIYRTLDSGKTWQQVYEEKRAGIFFDAIGFWDRKHGIVLSDPVGGKFALFTTEDGGDTWQQIPQDALPAALKNEGAFAASNSCLVVQGTSNAWFATGGASVARVFRSSDRGKTWAVSETPMHPGNASSGIFSLAFTDAMNGIAVGGDYAQPEGSNLPNMMQSHDGGATWHAGEPTDPAGVYLSSVARVQSGMFAAVGTKGVFVFAKGWLKQTDRSLNAAAASNRGSVIWVAGPEGTVTELAIEVDFRSVTKPRP